MPVMIVEYTDLMIRKCKKKSYALLKTTKQKNTENESDYYDFNLLFKADVKWLINRYRVIFLLNHLIYKTVLSTLNDNIVYSASH